MNRYLIIALIFVCLSICRAAETGVEIELIYLQTNCGKPPLRDFECSIKIKNNRAIPVWIVYPSNADDRLPVDGKILVSYWKPEFFSADGYEIPHGYEPKNPKNVGRFVLIRSLAGDARNSEFSTFYIPAGAEFEFKGYRFSAWKNVDDIEIWVAKDIIVNEKVSFSDWFPFVVIADKQVRMGWGTRSNENMNFDRKTYATRNDLRKEAVHTPKIEVLERHILPLAHCNESAN
jgi:hypothetical protein